MSIITIIQSTRPQSSFWSGTAVRFALAYYSLTVGFNIISTGFLITRLLVFRYRFRKYLGENHTSKYASIVAMLVESYALVAVWTILFLGLYIAKHPVQYIFLAPLIEIQIISPLLILFRVCQGTAWNSNTEANISNFQVQSVTRPERALGTTQMLSVNEGVSSVGVKIMVDVVKETESTLSLP
ncbi:hypothetical protein PM082_009741 [Marasmius tenuissimus]|nr:hypothetical protein PM082_009741 [Marasmius tenuissimus]